MTNGVRRPIAAGGSTVRWGMADTESTPGAGASATPVELGRRPPDAPPTGDTNTTAAGQPAWRRAAREALDNVSLAANVHLTRRHPVSVVHFVTRRCNARCSFCFIDFDHPEPRRLELSVAEIDRLTRTLGPNLQNVNLTGGEPFLRGDLVDIARAYYRNTGVRSVYITSNGSFPDRVERFARTIAAEFPDRKLIISLSIDSFADEHDRIRKLDGLFDKVLDTYHRVRAIGGGVMVNVAITVSHENHRIVDDLYEHLIEERGVRAITAIIVREEGVYEVPRDARAPVLASYRRLTDALVRDMRSGRLDGYDPASLQGRLMNRKNEMLYDIIVDTYLDPRFVSTCYAGSLFGVIDANGDVHPCEVLDRPLGNLRDHDMDFGDLWAADTARDTARWIKDSQCHCTYECAWAFNILGNARYQPRLLGAAFGRGGMPG